MQRSEDDANDREAIRREIRAYVSELLLEAGVEDRNPWHWALEALRCFVNWGKRGVAFFDIAWKTLVVLSLTGVAAWFATAFRLWSGVGWQ